MTIATIIVTGCLIAASLLLAYIASRATLDPDEPHCPVCECYDRLNMDAAWGGTYVAPKHDCPYARLPKADPAGENA